MSKVHSFFMLIFTVICSLSQAQAMNMDPTIFERLKVPLVGAHQGGYPWKAGNNSLEKFEQAILDGVDILEMDLRLTKDGTVVVFHDEDLSEDTNCTGKVAESNFFEITKCKYKRSGKSIEVFENIIKKISGKAIINAEFKVQEVVIPAIQLVQKNAAYNWVYFQTKAERERYLLARKTDSKIALLFKTLNQNDLEWILSFNDEYLVILEMEKDMAIPQHIKRAHDAGKLVSVNSWRYGSLEEFGGAACDKVFKLGIDIAIANNIRSCLKQKKYYKMARNP